MVVGSGAILRRPWIILWQPGSEPRIWVISDQVGCVKTVAEVVNAQDAGRAQLGGELCRGLMSCLVGIGPDNHPPGSKQKRIEIGIVYRSCSPEPGQTWTVREQGLCGIGGLFAFADDNLGIGEGVQPVQAIQS
jgi:hypothetical protein